MSIGWTAMVGWTGHRPNLFVDAAKARRRVEEVVEDVLDRHRPCQFVCGGQRGVDLWAAQAADRRGIPFHLVLPHSPDVFAQGWAKADRASLRALLSRAASVTTIDWSGQLGSVAYDLRSETVARRSDVLVAIWGGVRRGGTFLTLCAARSRGVPVQEVKIATRDDVSLAGHGV